MIRKHCDAANILQAIEKGFNAVCPVLFGRDRGRHAYLTAARLSRKCTDTNSLSLQNLKDSRKQSLSINCDYMKRPGHRLHFFLISLRGIKKPPTAMGGGCWLPALGRSYVPTPPADGVIRMRTIPMLACEQGENADSDMGARHSMFSDISVTSDNRRSSTLSLSHPRSTPFALIRCSCSSLIFLRGNSDTI